MPIHTFIHPHLGLAVFKYEGDIIVRDIVEAFLGYIKSPKFDPKFNVLVDQEHCTLTQADFNQMRLLSSLLLPYYETRGNASRTAFYAPGDVQYGVTRMYELISEQVVERRLEIFREREECLEFLGLDPQDAGIHETIWPSVVLFPVRAAAGG